MAISLVTPAPPAFIKSYGFHLAMSGLVITTLGGVSNAVLAQAPSQATTEATVMVIEGVLDAGDRVAQDNTLYDIHPFEGKAGDTVTITLESDAFDTYLVLIGPDEQVLAQNDDITPDNRNSEISFTLPTDEQYLVIANAYDETGQGPYRLSITATASGETAPSPATSGADSATGDALIQQGIQQYQQGQFTAAIATWQQALAQFQALSNDRRVSDLYNNLGEAYRSVGQYPLALDVLQRALNLSQTLGAEDDTGSTLNNLGLLYLDLGRYDQAQEFFEKALAVARRTQNRFGEAVALKNLGTAYYQLGNLQAALEANQQSLELRREVGDRFGEAATLNSMGIVYAAVGDFDKALSFYRQALAIDREVGNRAGESVVLSNIGNIYRRQGQLSEALASHQQSLNIHREVGNRRGEGSTLNQLGFTYLAMGQYSRAKAQFEAAIAIWESLDAQTLSDVDKVGLFETQTGSYDGLQQTLVAQGQVEAALTVAEQGRTRALVQQLTHQLANDTTVNQITPPDLDEIRQIAQDQAATLIEYAVINTGLDTTMLYIWVVQPDGTIQFEAVDLDQLEIPLQTLVELSRAAVGDRSRAGISVVYDPTAAASSAPLAQLYDVLIRPIEAYLPTDPEADVIVIPQGNLFLVPFAALQNAQGQYLIEQHTLLSAPSIQTLDLTRRLQQSRSALPLSELSGEDLLIVGNPTMPSVPPLVGETPIPLPNLPGAEQEAKAIAALFNTTALTTDDATESRIKQRLPTARVVHLATHGLLEYGQLATTGRLEVPGAVALAADSQEDGLLTAEEIVQLSLDADLVVLSACDTGLGNITGDGVIGLSRSLMTAGAPNIIVSLWAVPDAPTATLMTTFYEQLQQGQTKSQALRQAMLATLQDYPEPSAWAAFTLMGAADP